MEQLVQFTVTLELILQYLSWVDKSLVYYISTFAFISQTCQVKNDSVVLF